MCLATGPFFCYQFQMSDYSCETKKCFLQVVSFPPWLPKVFLFKWNGAHPHWAGALRKQLARPGQVRVLTVNVAWFASLSFEPSCLVVSGDCCLCAVGSRQRWHVQDLAGKREGSRRHRFLHTQSCSFLLKVRPHQSSFQEKLPGLYSHDLAGKGTCLWLDRCMKSVSSFFKIFIIS